MFCTWRIYVDIYGSRNCRLQRRRKKKLGSCIVMMQIANGFINQSVAGWPNTNALCSFYASLFFCFFLCKAISVTADIPPCVVSLLFLTTICSYFLHFLHARVSLFPRINLTGHERKDKTVGKTSQLSRSSFMFEPFHKMVLNLNPLHAMERLARACVNYKREKFDSTEITARCLFCSSRFHRE